MRTRRNGFTLIELLTCIGIFVVLGLVVYTTMINRGLVGAEVPMKGYVVNKNSFLADEGRIYRIMVKRHPDNTQYEFEVSQELFNVLTIDGGYNFTIKGDKRIIRADPPTKD